jgi:hypothetical protein
VGKLLESAKAAASGSIQKQLEALAAVLALVRRCLDDLSASLPDEEPGGGEEDDPSLRSILSCVLGDALDPAIRDLQRAAANEASSLDSGKPKRGSAGVLSSAFDRKLRREVAEREREMREAAELFSELDGLARAERDATLEDTRFHRRAVVERLFAEVRNALPGDPSRAEDLASIGAVVATHLADAGEAAAERARAACWIGTARRIAGDRAGAEEALSEATMDSSDGEVQAEICRAVALLRWEQGRSDEAAALLDRATAVWVDEEVPHEESACRVLRALLLVEEGRIGDVIGFLRDELELLADPWLSLFGGLASALGFAERGFVESAQARRAESLPLLHRTPPAAYLYTRRLEGLIAVRLGEAAAAERLLEEVRSGALEHGWLPDAALATLALAGLDAEQGLGCDRGRSRLAQLEAALGQGDASTGVLAIIRDFPAHAEPGERPRHAAAVLGATVLRRLRVHRFRSMPLPFA